MSATRLLRDLTAAGLHIVEEPGWKARGGAWRTDGEPEGVMIHHTAPPNPFPIKKLYGPPFYRTKCNMATHEDGTLYLIGYGAPNYSAGRGQASVLKNYVRQSIAPGHNATASGVTGGNSYFWAYENSHPGDGSPIPQIQLDTITESAKIVIAHFGMDPEQIISHAEWTRRKIDANWNGDNRTAIMQVRSAVAGPAPIPPPTTDWTEELIMALPKLKKYDGYSSYGKEALQPDVRNLQGLLLANGFKDDKSVDPVGATDGYFGPGTQTSVEDFQKDQGLTPDGVCGRKTWTSLLGQ